MRILLFTIALITISIQFTYAQNVSCKSSFLVVHYNVENLFDTIDDPHKIDNDFLPEGKKEWNSKKYWDKQQKIAYVLQQIDPNHLPDIISLVEIESINVLQDLVIQKELKKAKYQIFYELL